MLKQKVYESIANIMHKVHKVDGYMQTVILGVDTDLKVYKKEFGQTVEVSGKTFWATETQTDPIDLPVGQVSIRPTSVSIRTQTDFLENYQQ